MDALTLFWLAFVFGIISLANWAERKRSINSLYRLSVGGLLLMAAWWLGGVALNAIPTPARPAAISAHVAVIYTAIGGVAWLACVSLSIDRGLRQRLSKTLFRHTAYDPHSFVHTLALLLIIIMVLLLYGSFILNDGLQGIAADVAAERRAVEATGAPDYASFFEQLGIYVALSFLGVGLFVRRGIRAAFYRLGLRLPGIGEWAAGIGFGLAMYAYVFLLSSLLNFLLPQEAFRSLWGVSIMTDDTLLYGFLMAFSAGVGEELVFRGALQPIFGVWLTSLVFVMIHTNYTFTPSWGIIGIHALIFAWLRQQANTTTAMIAHFTYNFMPYLLMAWLAE